MSVLSGSSDPTTTRSRKDQDTMKKITSMFAVAALSLTFAATGCKKKAAEETKDPAMKTEEKGSGEMKKDEAKPDEMKKDEAKKDEAKPAGGGDFPAECNDYKAAVEKLMACDKMKAAAGPMKEAFDNAWKQMEGMPAEGRAAMKDGCKAGMDGIKTAMSAAGC